MTQLINEWITMEFVEHPRFARYVSTKKIVAWAVAIQSCGQFRVSLYDQRPQSLHARNTFQGL